MSGGTVCLQGGGEFSAACREMDADLVRRAGGGRVVVTALAGAPGSDYRTATTNGQRHFQQLGARDVVAAPDVREDAQALQVLRSARLLVLPGGSPSRLLKALQSTGADHVIRDMLADEGVVMGASAGAMVLCDWTVLPDNCMRVARGLGVVPGVVVLPHYRGGQHDWIAGLEAAVPVGTQVLGLPEESGVVLSDGQLTAAGRWATTLVREGRTLQPGEQRAWDG